MDVTTVDSQDAVQWGVVYSYGSVLTLFETEQDALNEASTFGGAVVQMARTVWSALCEPASSER
ncbi:hypothetical protein [Stutzerimonas chloritidismutans]|uniref:hypothetical protein n=1 Tax=Stutzerimonas chloritidismutans TaxID=203192 RepID=UPI003F14F939